MPQNGERVYLAVDLGAESGRVVAAQFDGKAIELIEVHRFPNGPVEHDDGLHWDFTSLWDNIVEGLTLSAKRWGKSIVSIGVDTWGVDYGLVDSQGNLLAEPFHYRDSRNDGMQDEAFKLVPKREVYDRTGIQFLPFNTVYQLLAESRANTNAYQQAAHLLFIPDLINHRLTGRLTNEYTIASTSQAMDAHSRQWALPMLKQLGIRTDLFCDLIEPGQTIGKITSTIAQQTGLHPNVQVVAVGSHDTASAVAGVPASGDGWAYLSSGTWSLLGIEVDKPIINDESFEHSFTNEGGVLGTVRVLKNISGLWLLQECRRQWQREGDNYTYGELASMAESAQPFARRLDPDDPVFTSPGRMPEKINNYLCAHAQQKCQDRALMARCILESLAIKYFDTLSILAQLSDRPIETLHIVGGGSKNRLLNQFTASATGKRVVTGPVEATAMGNILMQLIASSAVADLAAGRAIIAADSGSKVYEPIDHDKWLAQARK